jgi:hypothetical protein
MEALNPDLEAISSRLRSTGAGSDPAAFQVIGGYNEPALQKASIDAAPSYDELRQTMDDLVRADEAATVPNRDGIVIRRGNAPARN